MKNLYEKILEKWFYSNNEKVVRLNDIKEIFETANESVPAKTLVVPKIAEIEIVCPQSGLPTFGEFIESGVKQIEVWEPVDDGLSGEQIKKWKTIKVKCNNCGNIHEYALNVNPR